jgi:DNA-binding PucR family transcriptional regulator
VEITVGNILEIDILKGAKLIAGKKGLSRSVSSVTVGEVPDIADWLHGGEVVLSTLYAVSEDPQAQLEFVQRIIAGGASALLIKTERFVQSLEKKIVKAADSADFALIEVPTEVRWTDVVRKIYDTIIRTEVEMRMKGDLIDDILAGDFKPDDLIRRAGYLGADLKNGCLAMMIDIDRFRDIISERKLSEQDIQSLKREMFNAINWIVNGYSKNSMVSLKSDDVIVFLTPTDNITERQMFMEDADRVTRDILDTFKSRMKGMSLSAGLGRFYVDPKDLAKSFYEARTAMEIMRRLGRSDSVTKFDDVGIYKVLVRVMERDPQELATLYDESIAPLSDYDAKHKSELVYTLEVFLKNNQNLNDSATELFTHRHTVRYRLERIKELTGLDASKSDDLERLSLGLKAMRLLGH